VTPAGHTPRMHLTRRLAVLIGGVVVIASAVGLVVAFGGGGHAGSADPNHSIDPVHGAIGGVRVREPRGTAGRLLGRGARVSRRPMQGNTGYTVEQVRYTASGLDVWYVNEPGGTHRSIVALVSTTARRYRTTDGLGVGSTLAEAQREPALHCSNVSAPTYADCQGGLGYEKPVTTFQIRGGKVSRIIAISVAD
jgi:hypothetical protein